MSNQYLIYLEFDSVWEKLVNWIKLILWKFMRNKIQPFCLVLEAPWNDCNKIPINGIFLEKFQASNQMTINHHGEENRFSFSNSLWCFCFQHWNEGVASGAAGGNGKYTLGKFYNHSIILVLISKSLVRFPSQYSPSLFTWVDKIKITNRSNQ